MPDARGHGGTAWDAGESWTTPIWSPTSMRSSMPLGLETFHLLGYSLGGMTALHYATRFPERLRTLVAISIATERGAALSVGRVLMDPDRIERDDPGWADAPCEPTRPTHGRAAGVACLDAIVEDIATQPLLTPESCARSTRRRLSWRRPRPVRPHRPGRRAGRQVRDGRLSILPDVGHDSLVDHLPLLEAG
jgi:pimeloyl-ACP methyl ester carboxylesterase